MKSRDKILATFNPKKLDTLKPSALQYVGRTGQFEAFWIIDYGVYKGQWAMGIPKDWDSTDIEFCWVPEEDISPLSPQQYPA